LSIGTRYSFRGTTVDGHDLARRSPRCHAVVRPPPETAGDPRVARGAHPRTTADGPAGVSILTTWVRPAEWWYSPYQSRPLPDVPRHVVQLPAVRLKAPNRRHPRYSSSHSIVSHDAFIFFADASATFPNLQICRGSFVPAYRSRDLARAAYSHSAPWASDSRSPSGPTTPSRPRPCTLASIPQLRQPVAVRHRLEPVHAGDRESVPNPCVPAA